MNVALAGPSCSDTPASPASRKALPRKAGKALWLKQVSQQGESGDDRALLFLAALALPRDDSNWAATEYAAR